MKSESLMADYMCYICRIRVANLEEDANNHLKSIKKVAIPVSFTL